ncbi:iron permease FTR1 [Flammula alnicola]|nr:iron permease FTR1 [Flammula alnicola]
MTRNLFSVPIFFIVFRETLEAAIIISVLLGLAEQIVHNDSPQSTTTIPTEELSNEDKESNPDGGLDITPPVDDAVQRRRLVRKLRTQIFLGGGLGLFIALSIGAAFLAVWFTRASNLWAKSESLWEGYSSIFELIACLMIFVMGVTMLKMEKAKAKWRIKLQRAFDGKQVDGKTASGKWALFILPFVTVLREGLEGVIFVGGVSLGQPAASIPIAAIIGIVCGLVCGFIIYAFASRTTLTLFLVVMTNFLLLIGAGLFSKSVGAFQDHAFNKLLGADAGDTGKDGPGSYRVQGNVWHLQCCNPNNTFDGQGWTIFGAIFGWTNNATQGTVLAYVFYWLAVIVCLVYMKFKEASTKGRTMLLGRESAAGVRRRRARDIKAIEGSDEAESKGTLSAVEETRPVVSDIDLLPR